MLGVDGADPVILRRMMDQGKLPNFSRLAELGGFQELGTSNPPQSPVAWASFTTGLDPGGHGIFDFIHRDPKTMELKPSLSEVTEGGARLLRQGRPFWAYLTDRGVKATLLKVPANFPPKGLPGKVLAGMGTPDLEGSYGTFSYYTSAPETAPPNLSGGRFVQVEERNGVIRANLVGPGDRLLGLEVHREKKSALISITGQSQLILNEGEWSGWVPLDFDGTAGMARFYLKASQPHLKLYVSPINIDPSAPVTPVSSPESFSRHLCRCNGRFYTQGMPEDTKALVHGVFTDKEFLGQSELVQNERKRLFEQSLGEYEDGVFFFYLSTTDIVSHLYWNTIDDKHPGFSEQRAKDYDSAIEQAYIEADNYVGRLLEFHTETTTILVLSDHGFAPFYRNFGLNAWLESEGYLVQGSGGTDWTQTSAYGVGFNSLYLNLKNRETDGQVSAQERASLLAELETKLAGFEDPKSGRRVINKVYRPEDVYHGELVDQAPDLVLGYSRGYRASWQTVLGKTDGGILSDNLEPWSGDHLIDPELVPGILLCNRALKTEGANLLDIAPTILARFGVPIPSAMRGRDLLKN